MMNQLSATGSEADTGQSIQVGLRSTSGLISGARKSLLPHLQLVIIFLYILISLSAANTAQNEIIDVMHSLPLNN